MKNNAHHADFISHLQKLVDDNEGGAVAALKRSLQSETTSQIAAYPYVVSFLSEDDRKNDWAYFLVAGLFAMHPKHSIAHPDDSKWTSNLGTTCRQLGSEDENQATATWIIRFKALLDAEQNDVAHHLRSIISIAASKREPVNYVQLLGDLCQWSDGKKCVQMRMAREFWKLPKQNADLTTEETKS